MTTVPAGSNCGHLGPLLLSRDGTLAKLDSTATVIGLFEQWDCGISECQIQCGDTLVLYTDGITESFSDDAEEFGEQRLISALRDTPEGPAETVIASIIDHVRRFSPHEQHDDMTVIVARCRA